MENSFLADIWAVTGIRVCSPPELFDVPLCINGDGYFFFIILILKNIIIIFK
jgi:hypothetical protein